MCRPCRRQIDFYVGVTGAFVFSANKLRLDNKLLVVDSLITPALGAIGKDLPHVSTYHLKVTDVSHNYSKQRFFW